MEKVQWATDPGVLFNRLLARGRLRHLQLSQLWRTPAACSVPPHPWA